MPVLDTTYLIDLKRQPDRVQHVTDRLARELREGGSVLLPVQAAIEYAAGETDSNEALTALAASYEIRTVDEAVARTAAAAARRLVAERRPVPWSDLAIAAIALHEGTYVVTRNRRHLHDDLGARVWDYAREREPE